MVVNGSCQTPGWDFTYARVCQCKSPTWGETGHCLLISDAPEGCPQCWGWSCVWRCLYHIMAMWTSGPVGIPLIECFLLGLLEFTCQDNVFINTQYLIFGGNRGLSILRPSHFYQALFDVEKKKLIQTDPQSIIRDSWGLLFFRIHNFSDFRKGIWCIYHKHYIPRGSRSPS